MNNDTKKALIIILIAIWIITLGYVLLFSPKPMKASELTNGWVMGRYAANPNEEIIIVDEIEDRWYISYVYWIPAFQGDCTQFEFVSSSDSTGTPATLMIQGDLRSEFNSGDKVVIKFTLNEFIAGMPQQFTPLPTSSIEHYSGLSTLDFGPLILAIAVSIIIALALMIDRPKGVIGTQIGSEGQPRTCVNCGHVVERNLAFCPECGTTMEAHSSSSEAAATLSSDSSLNMYSIDKLERLKKLLDDDIINQDEFEQQKKKIMTPTTMNTMTQPSTLEDELRRLKELLDSGAITFDEYKKRKIRILTKL